MGILFSIGRLFDKYTVFTAIIVHNGPDVCHLLNLIVQYMPQWVAVWYIADLMLPGKKFYGNFNSPLSSYTSSGLII